MPVANSRSFCCRVIKCRAVKTRSTAAGQRLALATLSEEGIKALTVNGEWQADEYGNQWRQASLQGALTDPALATVNRYGNTLKNLTIPIALVAMRLLPLTITPSMHGRPLPEEWVREPA